MNTNIIDLLKNYARPLTFDELSEFLLLKSKKERSTLLKDLNLLSKKGKILITKSGTYCLSDEANLVKGVIQFNPNGFAFLIPEDPSATSDIFLRPNTLLESLNGDKVLVRIDKYKNNSKPEGTIVKTLERGLSEIVGIFEKSKNFAFVTPLDKRILRDFYIPNGKFNNAKSKDVVLIKITQYPTKSQNPVGEVIKVLGKYEENETIIATVNLKYKIKEDFDKKVIKAASALLSKPQEITKKIEDLRKIKFFTIDGVHAKDFDDAVALIKESSGNFRLFVSIADVERFVKENSIIDKEAFERGTSVYYPGMVYPMLPEALSNNLCSLTPLTDKFTFTVEMLIEPTQGEVIDYKIYKSVIKSFFRATYEEIGKLINENPPDLREKYRDIYEDITNMLELSNILREKRFEKGSIDFNLPEVEIEFDENKKVKNIKKVERNQAHILIEEFMLIANETVANFLNKKGIPLLYRVHEAPDEDKLFEISNILAKFGIFTKMRTPVEIQKCFNDIKGKQYENLVNYLVLRSMKQAVYTPKNIGHYALAKENYTHFTSPIRRYPDLINHRILKKAISGTLSPALIDTLNEKLFDMGVRCSTLERNAADAERDIVDLKKLEFMEDKIGNHYSGIITGVSSFGFFVEIDENLLEGLVHVRTLLDDYYSYIEGEYMIRGKRRGNYFRLGDKVEVELEKIDKIKKHADFILIKKL